MSVDSEDFEHAGLNCRITKTRQRHWCGYVECPDDLGPVRWTSDYDSKHNDVLRPEVEVWGGITYGPDQSGWVGFDDAHARPRAGAPRRRLRQGGRPRGDQAPRRADRRTRGTG